MHNSFIHRKIMDNVYAIGMRSLKSNDEKFSLCVMPSVRYWYADPVVYEWNGKTYLFAEQYDRFLKHGHIAVFEVTEENGEIRCSKPRRIITEKFHLSFPLVFKYADAYYMIPESCEDNSLLVYKMGVSVYDWSLVRRIQMKNSVDTVPVVDGTRVYLINTIEHPTKKLYGKQMVYAMDSFPDGDVNLVEEAGEYSLIRRNGGPVFYDNADMIRVCQNCTESFYGRSVSFYKILSCTMEDGYSDRFLKTVEPEDLKWRTIYKTLTITGTHTYCKTQKYEAVDISCNSYAYGNVIAKFIRKIQ